ncbi:hypothetical protein ANCCEY_15295 [Ancylostoma ceylanicum]|uniref:Uncharacterized protein n=1 Tax=Ancylostoma ceylanicum TaxID=53326 RepID=A0A0D6L523_9BILA|nr:hypothetical protein ANCCEY_15295 [Ancylostoma ceylanicum]
MSDRSYASLGIAQQKSISTGSVHDLCSNLSSQTSHFGCPTTDVVRLLNACLSAKDRRENWESLLEKFYSFLKDEVGDNNQMPCTLEQKTFSFQLKQAYRLYFPLGAFMIVPMIGPLFSLANNSDDVEYKERLPMRKYKSIS